MTTDAPPKPKRQLITGGDPDALAFVPHDGMFSEGDDFLADQRLADVGRILISRMFPQVDGLATVDFMWKAKGGKSGGNLTLGRCVKLSGPAKHYSQQTDFLIWIAADHCRAYALTNFGIEALLYHELCHLDIEEPEDEGDPIVKKTRGHDTELFYAEIEHYGLWKRDLERLANVVQPALPLE